MKEILVVGEMNKKSLDLQIIIMIVGMTLLILVWHYTPLSIIK